MSRSYAKRIQTGSDIVLVTPGASALAGGVCQALWIGTAGTINVTTEAGTEQDGVPAIVGLFPVRCTHVRAGGTAANIWAIYTTT